MYYVDDLADRKSMAKWNNFKMFLKFRQLVEIS